MERQVENPYRLNLKKVLLHTICGIAFIVIATLCSKADSFSIIIPQILIFCIAALALNIVCGCLGEMVIGHGGFMLVGGIVASYISQKVYVLLQTHFELSQTQMWDILYNPRTSHVGWVGYILVVVSVIIGAFITGIIGYIIGVLVLGRMKGDYLAIITLGIGLVFVSIADNIPTIDGFKYGVDGPSISNQIAGNTIIFGSFLLFTIVFFVLFFKSRFGRSILSIRENAIAAEASGIPVNKYKILTFTISAFFAGLAGGLYYHFAPSLDTDLFAQDRSIELLVFIVLGGLGSFTGTILSTALLTFVSYKLLLDAPPGLSKLIYGVILIIVMLIQPNGLLGTSEFSWNWFKPSTIKKQWEKIKIKWQKTKWYRKKNENKILSKNTLYQETKIKYEELNAKLNQLEEEYQRLKVGNQLGTQKEQLKEQMIQLKNEISCVKLDLDLAKDAALT